MVGHGHPVQQGHGSAGKERRTLGAAIDAHLDLFVLPVVAADTEFGDEFDDHFLDGGHLRVIGQMIADAHLLIQAQGGPRRHRGHQGVDILGAEMDHGFAACLQGGAEVFRQHQRLVRFGAQVEEGVVDHQGAFGRFRQAQHFAN